jgi:integrase
MALTDTRVRNAKPQQKPYKLSDTEGLFLFITPAGGKLWRLKYRFAGKEKLLALGKYPQVTLAEARDSKDEARKSVGQGIDPSLLKKRAKRQAVEDGGNTFATIATEYIAKRKREGLAQPTVTKAEYFLSNLMPGIGHLPVKDITAADILASVQKMESRDALESAKRTLQFAGRVLSYAVVTQRLKSNPARDLRGALTSHDVKHHAAILNPVKVGELLRAIDGYEGFPLTRLALQLSPHVFKRPGEVRGARWSEIDLVAGVWTIPSQRMKKRREHSVPLSSQAIAILSEAKKLSAHSQFVFSSVRTPTRPMSENTVNAALRRLGYTSEEMTAHGFRGTATTLLMASGKWSREIVKKALSHKEGDETWAAYERGDHWPQRVEMAQWWSDYLDQLRKGADIVQFPEREAV